MHVTVRVSDEIRKNNRLSVISRSPSLHYGTPHSLDLNYDHEEKFRIYFDRVDGGTGSCLHPYCCWFAEVVYIF